jgi:WD40 repeat protein
MRASEYGLDQRDFVMQLQPDRQVRLFVRTLSVLNCALVISASSDGTVKAWSPHSSNPPDPSTLGTHPDYVRCLAHSYVSPSSCLDYGSFMILITAENRTG